MSTRNDSDGNRSDRRESSGTSDHDKRFVPLSGTMNTRDLGGLPLEGGGVTRSGAFYRSDVPLGFKDEDYAELERRGVSTVIDLRQPGELERDPSCLHGREGIDWHHVVVWGHIPQDDGPADEYDIVAFYRAALDHAGKGFAQAVKLLARSEGAALFHCTAGKDRTGLLALLLLEVAGVDTEDIVEDFALTHDRIGPLRERLLTEAEKNGVSREQFSRLLGATPDMIEPAIEYLHERYGGAEKYLKLHGVTDEDIELVRRKLTD